MNVSELGEFGLIQRLAGAIGAAVPEELLVGIGDDAAAWRSRDAVLLATTDTLVEGVHFLPALAPWRDVGWKALAVSVSDIAAMGGEPMFALVTLALPPETAVEMTDELYAGLRECACEYGVTIAGGDIVRAFEVSVAIALIGRAQMRNVEPLLLRRNGAQPGNVIAVTGTLGDSAGGLHRLKLGTPARDQMVERHLRPKPPLQIAQQAARIDIRCGIDISDGLLQDIGHICEMSGLGTTILAPELPISDALRAAYPNDARMMACVGGEDYEMAFVAPRELIEQLKSTSSTPVTLIGEMNEGAPRVCLIDESGREISFDTTGWDHLRA